MRQPSRLSIAGALALATSVAAQPQAPPRETAVTGVVFEDRNGDGRRQADEPGVANAAVSNQIDVVLSASDGSYRLDGPGHGVAFVSVPRGKAVHGGFWRPISPAGAAAVDFPLVAIPDSDDFTFVHGSDTHVHEDSLPRLRAFVDLLKARTPSFALVSGDLIRDALRVGEAEASRLFELYARETGASSTPIWSAPGNHETFAIERHHSLVPKTHPLYGKGMYRKYLGPNYYSFNRGRVHFIALDTVDNDDLWYYGNVDRAQLAWLEKDLAAVPKGTTVVTFNHIPFLSSRTFGMGYTDTGVAPSLIRIGERTQYRHIVTNARDVLARLKDYRYTLSLAGHNHSFERIVLSPAAGATRFHMTAAVIGPAPELVRSESGVTLYRVRGDVIDDGEFIEIPVAAPRRTPGP